MIRQTVNAAILLACYGGSTALITYLVTVAPGALVLMLAIAWCIALLVIGPLQ